MPNKYHYENKLKRLIIEQHILQLPARDIIYPVYPSKFHWDNHCRFRGVIQKIGIPLVFLAKERSQTSPRPSLACHRRLEAKSPSSNSFPPAFRWLQIGRGFIQTKSGVENLPWFSTILSTIYQLQKSCPRKICAEAKWLASWIRSHF